MARRLQLEVFAAEHDLKIGTIADLIEYRNNNETTILREIQCTLPTRYGEFDLIGYCDTIDGQFHVALRKGEITDHTLVRVHLHDPMKDLLANIGSSAWPLDKAMARIAEEGGVLVILGREAAAETWRISSNYWRKISNTKACRVKRRVPRAP